jgi:hypothetical protein
MPSVTEALTGDIDMRDSSEKREYYRREEDVDEGLDWFVNIFEVLLGLILTVLWQVIRLGGLVAWNLVCWVRKSKAAQDDTDQS